MLKSFVLAAALAGVLPAAVAQTAFTVNGQFVSVEEQKQLMDFLRANGVTNEKQLKNAARSILLEQKIIEQAARNEGLLEDPRVRVLISEKQAQLYGSILSRRYASEHRSRKNRFGIVTTHFSLATIHTKSNFDISW